jgi:glycerol-3-phosphate responsive antiterminator
MKKIISSFLILCSFGAFAQNNLDTIYVRSLTLQAQDWALIVGGLSTSRDSVTVKAVRKVRTAVQATPNIVWTTNVTVDSLPGVIVLGMYSRAKNAAAGIIATRYTAITNAIAAKTVIAYWIGSIDASFNNEYLRIRDMGKYELLDQ